MRNSMVAVFLSMLSLAAILPLSAEGTCAKWFRLTLKEKYPNKSSASNLRLAEFALYDADGVAQEARFYINASGEACVKARAGMVLLLR